MSDTLILAGTYEQAASFARQRDLDRQWAYASPLLSRGAMFPIVWCVGTYWERGDLAEMRAALLPSCPIFLDEQGESTVPFPA